MPDAVQTLSTTLQGQLAGSGATAATILALSSAIVGGAQAAVAARQTRRVGLLAAVSMPAALPPDISLGQIAQSWNEVREAASFLAGAQSLDSQLSALRAFDTQGPLTGSIANIPFSTYATWGAALVAEAAAYEVLLAETLPA
jgi:hypothetical protein